METLSHSYLLEHSAGPVRRGLAVWCLLAAACTCCSSQRLSRKQELKLRIVYDYLFYPYEDDWSKRWQDIYTMDPYGADVKRLTSDHRSRSPAWSPDGRRIVYLRDEPVDPAKESARLKRVFFLDQEFGTVDRDLVLMPVTGRRTRKNAFKGVRKIAIAGPDNSVLQWLPNAESIALRSWNRLDLTVCITHGEQLSAKCDRLDTVDRIDKDCRMP